MAERQRVHQRRHRLFQATLAAGIVLLVSACGDSTQDATTNGGPGRSNQPTATPEGLPTTDTVAPVEDAWTEQGLTFLFGSDELHGILTLPTSEGPHPAVVMPVESPSIDGGLPSGVSSRYQTDLAHNLAAAGFAAFRYDPAGIGQSGGEVGFQSLQQRADETIAALRRVREHAAIQPDQIGLWGISQEAWVIAVAAADYPDDVAFIIAVSGSGISVAEQQVWGIETQSRAAGLEADEVAKATLFGRLLIDRQLTEPMFHDLNQQTMETLGDGPWQEFAALVYETDTTFSADDLGRMIEILTSIQDEPWAVALHLQNVVIPAMRSIPPDQIEAVQAATQQSLLLDPRDHLTKVRCPVLAFFGEVDIVQPSEQSAARYSEYLEEAGNANATIVTLPNVGHNIVLATPGYWDRMVEWLESL